MVGISASAPISNQHQVIFLYPWRQRGGCICGGSVMAAADAGSQATTAVLWQCNITGICSKVMQKGGTPASMLLYVLLINLQAYGLWLFLGAAYVQVDNK